MDYISIGRKIANGRSIKGLTQEELAEKINSNAGYISNIETGKKNLYLYDSKEETLQRYYNGEVEKKDEIIKNYSMFLIGSGGLILVLCIILIILCVKLVKKNNNKVMNNKKTVNIPKKDPRVKEED